MNGRKDRLMYNHEHPQALDTRRSVIWNDRTLIPTSENTI